MQRAKTMQTRGEKKKKKEERKKEERRRSGKKWFRRKCVVVRRLAGKIVVADVSAVTWQQAISTLAILPPFANPLSHSAILYSILVPLDSTDRQNGRGWNALSGPHPDEDARERDLSSSAVGEREKRSWTFVRTQERGTIKTRRRYSKEGIRREGTVRCVRASFGYNRFVPAPFLRNTICVFFALLRETYISHSLSLFLSARVPLPRGYLFDRRIRTKFAVFLFPVQGESLRWWGGTNIRKNRTRLSSFPLSFSSFFLRSTFACQRPTPCCVSSAHRDLRILKYLSNSNRKLANRDDFFFYLSLRESSYFPRRLKRPILDYLFKRKFCRWRLTDFDRSTRLDSRPCFEITDRDTNDA